MQQSSEPNTDGRKRNWAVIIFSYFAAAVLGGVANAISGYVERSAEAGVSAFEQAWSWVSAPSSVSWGIVVAAILLLCSQLALSVYWFARQVRQRLSPDHVEAFRGGIYFGRPWSWKQISYAGAPLELEQLCPSDGHRPFGPEGSMCDQTTAAASRRHNNRSMDVAAPCAFCGQALHYPKDIYSRVELLIRGDVSSGAWRQQQRAFKKFQGSVTP